MINAWFVKSSIKLTQRKIPLKNSSFKKKKKTLIVIYWNITDRQKFALPSSSSFMMKAALCSSPNIENDGEESST